MANPVAKRTLDQILLPEDRQIEKKQKIDHSFVPDTSLVSTTSLSPQRVSTISNDESFDELSFSEDLSLPFIELEKKYSSLFETNFIEFTDAIQVGVIHDVDMDEFAVVDGDKVLGTQGVNTCFVVCAKGSTADGIKLALCHFSSVQSEDYIIKLIEKKLEEAGCKGKIEIYIIGGSLPVPENLDDFPGTLETEQRLLENASTYVISGVQLHVTQGESAIDVVFTAQKIYWGYDLYAEDTISAGQELVEID